LLLSPQINADVRSVPDLVVQQALKAKAAPRFAFEYRFDNNGHLDITPLSDGFLVVTLGDTTGARDSYTLGSQDGC
jgi:hypothetical protein